MKKSRILIIALIVCLVGLGAGALLIFSDSIGLTYANAEKYTAGETTVTEPVENLNVNWKSGNVKIVYHAGEGIRVSETGNREIKGEDELRWWLDGATLRIQYAKSGRFRLFVLKSAKIHTTSGDLDIPALNADETELEVTSGDIKAAADTRTMKVSATSGDLDITLTGETDTVAIDVTSGRINAELENAKRVTVKSTSGGIRVTGKAGEAEVSATSGNIDVRFSTIERLKINVTSGDVVAALPETPGFTCEATMTSGSFKSDIAVTNNGNTYTCGDGSMKCEIHTTSGNIRIAKAD